MENTNEPISNQPVMTTPDTLNHNSNTLLIVGAIILIGLGLLGGYLLFSSNSIDQQNTNIQSQIPPTIEVDQSSLNPNQTPDLIPQENALYLADYQGEKVIFYTNKSLQRYYPVDETPPPYNPYLGMMAVSKGGGYSAFNYKKLENPKKIYAEANKIIIDLTFKLNTKGSFLYAGILTNTKSGINNDDIQHIYKINLTTLVNKEIWSHEVGSNNYPEAKGIASISQVSDDKYLVLSLGSCYGCEPSLAGYLMVNMETGQEKYLQDIGDIQVNSKNNSFTYKKLLPFQESCESTSPGCDNGLMIVQRPSGSIITATLP